MNVSHLLTDTVTVKAPSTVDNYGDVSFGASSTIKARVEKKQKLHRDDAGNEVATNHVILTETEITQGSRVWLPGSDTTDDNDALVPLQWGQASTFGGYTIYEVYV
jgi:hypothetical protein